MKTIKLEQIDRVALLTLNRPDVLNALNAELLTELNETLQALDASNDIGCVVITGAGRAFAAGADISELAGKSHAQVCNENLLAQWDTFAATRTPKIAAVHGYALGGGCELAMMCDIVFAAETAKFGQPEIKLGLIPGMGGSQRLTRLIGKSKAMDMILTGRMMDATEAERSGLVARIFSDDTLLEQTITVAQGISASSKHTAIAARGAINQSLESSLSAGIQFERHSYHSLWASSDAHEGMNAFLEKRAPVFEHQK